MSDIHDLILYDRSRVVTDWNCPRKRYLQYEWHGRGIVSGITSLELFLGTTLHDGLAAIASMAQVGEVDIESIACLARQQVMETLLDDTTGLEEAVNFAYEQAALIEGLLRGFHRHVWPRLMASYPIILHIEQEMEFRHDGLLFMSKPDLVVADKEGNVWYIEYKSTSSKKDSWVNSWQTAVQLHSTCRAIQATTGESVRGVIVQGLYKGYESYGKQSSPFCYAYKRPGNPPFTTEQIRYDYAAGFKRSPTWELPGGVRQWVADMPDDVLASQFPVVPPIFLNEAMVDAFFLQRAYREKEISIAKQLMTMDDSGDVIDAAFPQRFDQCRPYFGRECGYLRICHGHVDDPLQSGFKLRESHHALEAEQQKEADDAIICTE